MTIDQVREAYRNRSDQPESCQSLIALLLAEIAARLIRMDERTARLEKERKVLPPADALSSSGIAP